jgi:hypothetical protein
VERNSNKTRSASRKKNGQGFTKSRGAAKIRGRTQGEKRYACGRQREPSVTRPSLTFVIESIDAVDAGTLMVASQDKKVLRVFDLIREQQADGLQALLATIDVVSGESCCGGRTVVESRCWHHTTPHHKLAKAYLTQGRGSSHPLQYNRKGYGQNMVRCMQRSKGEMQGEGGV